jgi:hypothetical protein
LASGAVADFEMTRDRNSARTIYTIHASKDGESIQTARISPTATVAKARVLLKEGWQVHVTDADGRQYLSDKFGEILSFDRTSAIKF